MSKRAYTLICLILLLFVAFNIYNDKYYMNYKIGSLEINNASKTSRNDATIYGDGSNEGNFVSTPATNLPKGEYKIVIKYKTDTNANSINITGNTGSKDILLSEELNSSEQKKVINLTLENDTYSLKIDTYFGGEGKLVIKNILVESAQISCTDTIAWLVIFMFVLVILGRLVFDKTTKGNRENGFVFLGLLAITIFASFPLYSNYILNGHDILFHVTRIEGIKNGLLSGQFPVRLHPSTQYNYGYAPSLFYPELFLYFPALLRILGVSITGTIQMFIIVINFMTAGIMYFSTYKLSKVKAIAILSSMIYVLSSYHLCDTYIRFALGETLAMAFIPLLVYGVYELICNDYSKWPYVVIGATCILQSHIITTLVAIVFVAFTVLLNFKNILEKNRLIACIKSAVFAVLLNLWFIIPFIDMMGEDTKVSSLAKNVEENTVYLMQLFENLTMLQIGAPILLGVVVVVYSLINRKIEDRKQEKLIAVLLGFGVLSAFITTNLFPWRIIIKVPVIGEMAKMIQFPWRILAFASAFLSIVSAYGIYYIVKNVEIRKALGIFVCAICLVCSSLYLESNYLQNTIFCYKGAISDNTGIGSSGEYYYSGTSAKAFVERGEIIETSNEQVVIDKFERIKGRIHIDLVNQSDEEQFIEVPLAYYPFYSAKLNNEVNLRIEKGSNNVLRIILPADTKGNINIYYAKSKLWLLSDLISLLTSVIFIIILVRLYKKESFKNKPIIKIS